jgi:hypothetical protein
MDKVQRANFFMLLVIHDFHKKKYLFLSNLIKENKDQIQILHISIDTY